MSTSERGGRRPASLVRRAGSPGFRYASPRNFRGRRSFSARETTIDTTSGITTTITARVAAGLGREKPACQF